METSLLSTKVRIPPHRRQDVPRARLLDALEGGVPHYKVVLLSAPAGYGKTTLLSQWAHASRLPIAWLSLDEDDNDPDRFLRYLLKGWAAIQPAVMDSPLGVLLGSMLPDRQTVLSAFINVASDAAGPLAFVLDDYHLIEEPAIHQALTFLLDHLPPPLHFVLAGRAEPPLPLARYRARHELLELRSEDLQFRPEETADFMRGSMGLDLAHEEVDRLQAQTEGWAAGLQLAALSLGRRGQAPAEGLASGRQRFITDYLREDVLARLPEEMRQFLLQTSLLESLCGPLCDAMAEGQGSQEMLERLERENLFLLPLDDRRQWFRYHPLFAGFLQGELSRSNPDEVAGLHRRAAGWYLSHELPEQAFQHSVAADHVEMVLAILEKYFNAKLNAGEVRVMERWVGALPAAWFATYPALDLMRAGLLAVTGEFEACVRLVTDVEHRLAAVENEETPWQLAWLMAVRCFLACAQNDLAEAQSYADRALRALPEEDVAFRPGVYGTLGDAYRRNGHWAEAKECYLGALRVTSAPVVRLQAAHVFGALADLELRQGRLQNAAGYWRKALAAIQERENWGRLELPTIGWVYIRMGELLYEWNQPAEAWDHVSQGLERAELGGDPRTMLAGYLIAGRLKLTARNIGAAADYLEKARPLVENDPFPDWAGRFGRLQLELLLAQDRLRAAVNWADERLRGDVLAGPLESEEAQLAMARALIVKGDGPSLAQALALLERLLRAAEGEGRMGIQIEALALQALAHGQRGEGGRVMTSLERALRLAEPEGYLRLFADLGLPMARLLQEARSRALMPEYIGQLLAAAGDYFAFPARTKGKLPEPLSLREQEVLRLIAAGLTNREIAVELVVSPETIKKHSGSIYGKLGVSNRTEAAARARELDLLD